MSLWEAKAHGVVHRIDLKPLSVNQAWKGRRFKTDRYKAYIRSCRALLPKIEVPQGCKLQIHFVFGFSSAGSDWDNPIKPLQDIMQDLYGFNDSRIYRGITDKVLVKKGSEFIEFSITPLEDKDL